MWYDGIVYKPVPFSYFFWKNDMIAYYSRFFDHKEHKNGKKKFLFYFFQH